MTSAEIRIVTAAMRTARSTILRHGVKAIVGESRHRSSVDSIDRALIQLKNAHTRAVRAERGRETAGMEG